MRRTDVFQIEKFYVRTYISCDVGQEADNTYCTRMYNYIVHQDPILKFISMVKPTLVNVIYVCPDKLVSR